MAEQTIAVFTATVGEYRPALAEMLDPTELGRLERLLRPADVVRSALAMALLRLVASDRSGLDPRHVPVDRTCPRCGAPHGKPRIAGGHHYSVAHSGDLVVVAVTTVGEIGVDVEPADRPRPAGTVPPAEREAELRSWVRREAVVKAIGDGRAVERDDPVVTELDGHPMLVSVSGLEPEAIALIDLDLAPGYIASLAVLATRTFDIVHHQGAPLLARWTARSGPRSD